MTSMVGGAADKTGNRYEHLWTALRLADLLEGKASRIRLEPPSAAGTGIEFEVDIDGATWGEQLKDSSQNWTINRLNTEGVLAAAKHQVALGRKFRLIASAQTTVLETLTNRARATVSLSEFEGALTKELTPDLETLCAHLKITKEDAFQLLKNIYAEQWPMAALDRIVKTTVKRIYADDPEIVIGALRQFCDEHIHEECTAPLVAAYLEGVGLQRRLLVGNHTVGDQLHRTVRRHQLRAESVQPQFGLVRRADSDNLIAALTAPDGPQLTILDGKAGYGKSTVVSEAAARLEESGWFVAVARMDDGVPISTSDQLGIQMSLSESPAVLISGLAGESKALLVIDQLDAVSIFSGRIPNSFDAVIEVLDEISRVPNVKVLLVSRTVDLNNDPRIGGLLKGKYAANRITLGLLELGDVKDYLELNYGHAPSGATLELLRTPLHLAVYVYLSDQGRQRSYQSLQGLYEELTTDVRRRAAQRVGSLDWDGITSTLVDYMSSNEVLWAPIAILDQFAPGEVSALVSEGILVRDDTGIAFMHESNFDYLFARGFINSGGAVHPFLAESGQYLFRRSQTRQILEHLASTDRPAFRQAVAEVLAASDIRSHIKDVITTLLRQIMPTAEDWEAIEEIAWGNSLIAPKVRALLSEPGWFDAADQLGRWPDWLANEDRVDLVLRPLISAAKGRPARVAELVRPHKGSTDAWRERFSALVSWSLTPDLVDLAVELIEAGEIDAARGPITVNSDYWTILYGLEEHPEQAARMVGAYLRRALVRAQSEGSADPFTSEHLAMDSQSGTIISDVAANAPAEFLSEVLPFVIAVAMSDQKERDHRFPSGARWGYQYRETAFRVQDKLFAATDSALRALAPQHAIPEAQFRTLREAESSELRFLACRALTASNDPDAAVTWLVGDLRNFALGWADSPNWASRELIEAYTPNCSDELFEQLEAVLLSDSNWLASRRELEQYTLLSALDMNRASLNAKRRLGELQRQFTPNPPPPPQPIRAQWVGPPIPHDATRHMSDDNWLTALRKYNGGGRWRAGVRVGGAMELARELGERASEDPERFSQLALRFDASIPAVAMGQIIRNIARAVPLDLLADVCEHAASQYDESVGNDICLTIAGIGKASPRLVELLAKYSQAEDPTQDEPRAAGTDSALYGGDLFNAGLNSTRGACAVAVAEIISVDGELTDLLLPVVTRLAADPVLAVRTRAAEAVIALARHRPEAALDCAMSLFDCDIEVLDAPSSEELLMQSVSYAPERFTPVMQRMLNGSMQVAKRAGRIWAIADHRGAIRAPLAATVADLPTAARVGAAEILSANVADSADHLAILFNDSEADVRAAAARSMRHLPDPMPSRIEQLVDEFIESPAFVDHMDDLIDGLEEMTSTLPRAALKACQRAVEVAADDLGDMRTARATLGQDVVKILLRLYRQGDNETRTQCLDIVDSLVDRNAYGVAQVLDDER